MKKKPDVKKILNIVKTVLIWAVAAVAVFMMVFTLISVNTFNKNDRSLFGYKFYVVQTDSMAATDFKAGDIAISKEVPTSSLQEGDIITFISQNPDSYGETITHKIRTVTRDTDGSIAFVTYGTTTDTNDEALAKVILGRYVGKIPNVGAFFLYLKTTPGYIICILIPFLVLILSQGINVIRLFRRYRAEQMSEMKAEREKLEEERAQTQRMMAELLEFREKFAQSNASETPPAAPDPAPAAQPEEASDAGTDSTGTEDA